MAKNPEVFLLFCGIIVAFSAALPATKAQTKNTTISTSLDHIETNYQEKLLERLLGRFKNVNVSYDNFDNKSQAYVTNLLSNNSGGLQKMESVSNRDVDRTEDTVVTVLANDPSSPLYGNEAFKKEALLTKVPPDTTQKPTTKKPAQVDNTAQATKKAAVQATTVAANIAGRKLAVDMATVLAVLSVHCGLL